MVKGDFIKDFLFESKIDNKRGIITIVAASAEGVGGSGVIAIIYFKLVGSSGNATSLEVTGLELCDEKGNILPAKVAPGKLS